MTAVPAGRCALCGATEVIELLTASSARSCQSLVEVPLASAGSGPLRIVLCPRCDLTWNAAYDAAAYLSTYGEQYYCSFTASETARRVQQDVARQLDDALTMRGRTAVEIGSGDGYFLSALAAHGARAIGFEPSGTPAAADLPDSAIDVRCQYFEFARGADIGSGADLLVMRHVAEHLPTGPSVFAQLAQATFNDRGARWLYVEVPEVSYLLERRLYCDFYYDHIWYYSEATLTSALRAGGWQVRRRLDTPAEFVGLLAERIADGSPDEPNGHLRDAATRFAAGFGQWKIAGAQLLDASHRRGERLAVWGTGSRGACFLHTFGLSSRTLCCLVDTDPRKHGRFVPGIDVPIGPPASLAGCADLVLVTSHTFFDEIAASLPAMAGRALPLIRPYPEFSVV